MKRKALANKPNIARQTYEIYLSNNLFDRLATTQNNARETYLACNRQKMFSKQNLLGDQSIITRAPVIATTTFSCCWSWKAAQTGTHVRI